MSGSLHAWFSRRELEALADREGVISGELELRRFARLVGMLHSDAGSVRASLRFNQGRGGWLEVAVHYEASVELTCQRCLEPFRHELAEDVNVVLVDPEAVPATVPEGFEPYELAEGGFSPLQLIEDELIVAIPLAPKHERLADCGSVARNRAVMTPDSDGAAGAAGQ
jgi:uncharacterized protein